ncbi:ribonuclease H-like domain-containing protein [Tanacetum coccineum]
MGYVKNPGPKSTGTRTFNANSVSSSNEKGASLSFTNEQMLKLINLINDSPSGSVQAIMADSDANQHMNVSTLNMFGIIDISYLNLAVGHPNGTVAKIKYVGNLKLSEKIVLFDVLVVSEYCVSLLSVNKLIKDSRMFVGFTETKCFIQDLHQNKIVGTSSENGGLYMFDSISPLSSNCQTIGNQSSVCYVSKSVWHTRLGHPSDQAVDMLHQDLNFTKDSHVSPCDICHTKVSLVSFLLTSVTMLRNKVFQAPNAEGGAQPFSSSADDSEVDLATSMGDNSSSEGSVPSNSGPLSQSNLPGNSSQGLPDLRRSSRTVRQLARLNDYVSTEPTTYSEAIKNPQYGLKSMNIKTEVNS